ncbi:MAG: hypothetical protein WCK57_01895 [Verrucomicrobiae bacterium]
MHTGHTPIRSNAEIIPEGQAPLPANFDSLHIAAGHHPGADLLVNGLESIRRQLHRQFDLSDIMNIDVPMDTIEKFVKEYDIRLGASSADVRRTIRIHAN